MFRLIKLKLKSSFIISNQSKMLTTDNKLDSQSSEINEKNLMQNFCPLFPFQLLISTQYDTYILVFTLLILCHIV